MISGVLATKKKEELPKQNSFDQLRKFSEKEVRLIGADGEQIGIVSMQQALQKAVDAGLTLQVVSASVCPPVCRIMDVGKLAYLKQKRQRSKKKSSSDMKQINFRVQIGEHDYATKIKQAQRIIKEGNKCKIFVKFRGREIQYINNAFPFLTKVEEDVREFAKVTFPAKREGNNVFMIVSPV